MNDKEYSVKRKSLNKDKDLSTILDYSLDIEYHLKMIRQYSSEQEEFDEMISEDVNEIKFLIKEIFELALKCQYMNQYYLD